MTMYAAGKLGQVANERRNNELSILGISEPCHWRKHFSTKAHLQSNLEIAFKGGIYSFIRHSTMLIGDVFGSYWRNTKYLKRIPASFRTRTKEGLTCSVIHNGQPTELCKQVWDKVVYCPLSYFFLWSIGLWNNPSHKKKWNTMGITATTGRPDFAGDLALLSHTQQQMQEKTNIVAEHSVRLGLNIHRGKNKILRVNSASTVLVTLGVER